MNVEYNNNNTTNEPFNIYIKLAKDLSLLYPASLVMSSKKSPQLIQIQFFNSSISLVELFNLISTYKLKIITIEVMNYKEGLLLTFITKE